ncbi:MAG: multiheme c-type cytochrome [Nitrospirota bacterium]
MKKRSCKWSRWGIITVLLFLIIPGCSTDEEKKMISEEKAAKARANDLSLDSLGDPEYVGSEKCKECHWREHDSWKHTLHSKFIRPINELSVVGHFQHDNKLTVKVTGKSPNLAREEITTTMFIKNGKYYVNTIGPDWKYHDYEIMNVIGVNRKQNYITKFPNGELHVLPVEWQDSEKKWVDLNGLERYYPGSGKYWSDPGRIWQFKCGSCHVTGMNIGYNKSSDSFDTTWVDLGIGCEACHGAGSNHIIAAKSFQREKETIINPAKLPWKLRAMVCGQCHNWGASTADISPTKEGFPKKYAFPYGYAVGKALHIYYEDEPDEEKKHHQQYTEWLDSPHAEAGIICLTCHGVHQEGAHRSPNKSQTKAPANTLCTGCHKAVKLKAAHRIHTFGSCIACHMPKSKGHEHSHSFKFVSPEESLRAGGIDKKMNSCSGCHYHAKDRLEGLVEFLDAIKREDMPVPFGVHQY